MNKRRVKCIYFRTFELLISCIAIMAPQNLSAEPDYDVYDPGAADLKPIQTLELSGCELNRVMINPVFTEFTVVALGDGVVQSVNLKTHETMWVNDLNETYEKEGQNEKIDLEAISFSPNGESTIVAGGHFLAQISSLSGKILKNFISEKSIFYTAVTASKDNRFIAAVGTYELSPQDFDLYTVGKLSKDFTIAKRIYPQILQLWDAESGRLIAETRFEDALIRDIGFSPDALTVFTGSFRAVRFFRLPQLGKIMEIDASILGGSISDIIMSTAISKDLRFVAVKSLNSIVLLSTESKKEVKRIYGYTKNGSDFRESLNSAIYITFSKDDTSLELTDLDGLYMSVSLPDGAVQSAVRSQGFDRSTVLKNNRRSLVAYDPLRRFVLETLPPPPRRFVIDTMPFPQSSPSRCPGLRMILLPGAWGGPPTGI